MINGVAIPTAKIVAGLILAGAGLAPDGLAPDGLAPAGAGLEPAGAGLAPAGLNPLTTGNNVGAQNAPPGVKLFNTNVHTASYDIQPTSPPKPKSTSSKASKPKPKRANTLDTTSTTATDSPSATSVSATPAGTTSVSAETPEPTIMPYKPMVPCEGLPLPIDLDGMKCYMVEYSDGRIDWGYQKIRPYDNGQALRYGCPGLGVPIPTDEYQCVNSNNGRQGVSSYERRKSNGAISFSKQSMPMYGVMLIGGVLTVVAHGIF